MLRNQWRFISNKGNMMSVMSFSYAAPHPVMLCSTFASALGMLDYLIYQIADVQANSNWCKCATRPEMFTRKMRTAVFGSITAEPVGLCAFILETLLLSQSRTSRYAQYVSIGTRSRRWKISRGKDGERMLTKNLGPFNHQHFTFPRYSVLSR